MNKKLLISLTSTALLALPAVMLAFNPGPIPEPILGLDVNTLIDTVLGIIWPIAVAFFVIMFIFAAFMFFTAQGDATKVAQARQFVIWGIVGVVVAFLAFTIPFVVRTTLGVPN